MLLRLMIAVLGKAELKLGNYEANTADPLIIDDGPTSSNTALLFF